MGERPKRHFLPIPALLVSTYIVWIIFGMILLMLPQSSLDGLTLSEALFTSTSAVTVTGLIVVDTATELTRFGQGVLMLLIQLGGMGLMTFAVLFITSFGRAVGLTERRFLGAEMGVQDLSTVLDLVWVIFRIVLFCEVVGIVFFAIEFVPEFGWKDGLWHSAFHTISAFNNAGFSTFSDSLRQYSTSPTIMITTSLLFIFGGLGFVAWGDLFRNRKWAALTLHTKIMMTGTMCLIFIGFSGYAILEWTNPKTLDTIDGGFSKGLAAWFEGVTPRTAGFNALDTASMRDSTTLLTMVLMVIGGGPTSTAGGIKVTTAVVLILATIAFFKNSGRMNAFGYSVGDRAGIKVMALLTVSLFVIIIGLFIIVATHDIDFLVVMFEVTSAFGTVGLSQGATSQLNELGRGVIILIMFLGRVGPLSLGIFLATKVPQRVSRPEGEVFLG